MAVVSRGWCQKHYTRWVRHGSPMTTKRTASDVPLADRFWAKVDISGDCWLWSGAIYAESGYGRLSFQRKALGAHRVAWQLVNGPIPDGMLVCHRCDNPPCVRADHLFLGTQSDNIADMWAKGRR